MKYIVILILAGLFGLGCRENRMKAFVPGTYVKVTESKFGKAWDTLRMAPLGGKSYRVERSIGYQSMLDGQLLEKKFKRSRWASELEVARRELRDKAFGHVLRLLPDSNGLEMGGMRFYKINP